MKVDYDAFLKDYPLITFRVRCFDCDLARAFRLTHLVMELGGEVSLMQALEWATADCWKADWKPDDETEPCGAYLPDLVPHRRLKVVEQWP